MKSFRQYLKLTEAIISSETWETAAKKAKLEHAEMPNVASPERPAWYKHHWGSPGTTPGTPRYHEFHGWLDRKGKFWPADHVTSAAQLARHLYPLNHNIKSGREDVQSILELGVTRISAYGRYMSVASHHTMSYEQQQAIKHAIHHGGFKSISHKVGGHEYNARDDFPSFKNRVHDVVSGKGAESLAEASSVHNYEKWGVISPNTKKCYDGNTHPDARIHMDLVRDICKKSNDSAEHRDWVHYAQEREVLGDRIFNIRTFSRHGLDFIANHFDKLPIDKDVKKINYEHYPRGLGSMEGAESFRGSPSVIKKRIENYSKTYKPQIR